MRQKPIERMKDAQSALVRNDNHGLPVRGLIRAPRIITAMAPTDVATTGSSQLWNA